MSPNSMAQTFYDSNEPFIVDWGVVGCLVSDCWCAVYVESVLKGGLSLIVRLCFNDPNFPPPEYTLFRKIFEEDPSIFIEWDVENHTQKPKKFSLYPKYCGLISHYKVCENKVCEKQLLGGGASLHKKSVVKNPRGCLQHKCMDTLWSAFHKSSALWRQEVVVPLHPYNALNACHGNTTYDF